MNNNHFTQCIAVHVHDHPKHIIEIIDYTLDDDGAIIATAITDIGDVIDIPAADVIPTCAINIHEQAA